MLDRILFAAKIKSLRLQHQLTIKELETLSSCMKRSSVSGWENSSNMPYADVITEYSRIFSVSADWLIGYSDDPYDEKVLLAIESELLSESIDYNGVEISLIKKVEWIPEEYWNPKLRIKTYSLPVRANIVFLWHIYIAKLRTDLEEQFKKDASWNWVNSIMEFRKELESKTATHNSKIKRYELNMKQLMELLKAKKDAKPIFVIAA